MSIALLERWNAMGPCALITRYSQTTPIKTKYSLTERLERNSVLKAVRAAALFAFQSSWPR